MEAGHIAGSEPPQAAPGHIDGAPQSAVQSWEEAAKEWAELEARRREISDEEGNLKSRQAVLAERILDHFAEHSIKSVHIDGIGKVGTRRELWAKVKRQGDEITDQDRAAAIAALRAAGLGNYVTEKYDTRTISALFRGWEQEGVDPPPELAEAWETEPTTKLTLRKD